MNRKLSFFPAGFFYSAHLKDTRSVGHKKGWIGQKYARSKQKIVTNMNPSTHYLWEKDSQRLTSSKLMT